jgi:hypothetical protein
MNPSIHEETGATARALIDALKAHPAVLAMSVINMGLLVFIYVALAGAAKSREALVNQVLSNSTAIHQMLAQRAVSCPDVTPPP